MAFIEIRGLTYAYPTSPGPVLKDIDLSVEKGEFVALIGPNGAGKSSLCYTIAGFIPHFFNGKLEGEVRVDGMDTLHATLNDVVLKVGLVFQNPFNQISGAKFTVFDEIAFGLENIGTPRGVMNARVEQAMELTGITSLANRSPYALSGGQQQRVALASILVMQPKVLVLDEPTSQLDPIGSREVFQVIKALSQQGITIVMAEHKVEKIAEFADRIVAMVEGEIVLEGIPSQVLASELLPQQGIGISRYTSTARKAVEVGLLPPHQPLPVTLGEALNVFGRKRSAH
jgi:energy-coupling factor transport system ATP-binding protein